MRLFEVSVGPGSMYKGEKGGMVLVWRTPGLGMLSKLARIE